MLLRDGVGEKLSKTAPVDDLMQLLRTEGSPYHQEKFRLKAKNTHANVVTTGVKQDRRWNAEQPSATLDP